MNLPQSCTPPPGVNQMVCLPAVTGLSAGPDESNHAVRPGQRAATGDRQLKEPFVVVRCAVCCTQMGVCCPSLLDSDSTSRQAQGLGASMLFEKKKA